MSESVVEYGLNTFTEDQLVQEADDCISFRKYLLHNYPFLIYQKYNTYIKSFTRSIEIKISLFLK